MPMAESSLRVLWLYPEHMNIYADRGNIAVLERRCRWRGIGFDLARAGPGESVDPGAHDLFYIGGGQDRDQALVARDLVETKREALRAAVTDGASVLAVCGGYQLLGGSYALSETDLLPGLGLVDLETVREPGPRLIGNVVIEVDLGVRSHADLRVSRTTAGEPISARASSLSVGWYRASATTAATASKECDATG